MLTMAYLYDVSKIKFLLYNTLDNLKSTPTGTRTQIYCLGGGYSIQLNYGSKYNYLMVLPVSISFVGETKAKSPFSSSAINIIPCDSTPLIFLGAKLSKMLTF